MESYGHELMENHVMARHVTSRVTVDIIINFGRRQLRRPIMPDDYLWMWASSMIAIIA